MKYMVARDAWVGCGDSDGCLPAGLEGGGQRRLFQSSLELLRRARHLRETGGSPIFAFPDPFRRRRWLSGSPQSRELSSSPSASETSGEMGDTKADGTEKKALQEKYRKRRKLVVLSGSVIRKAGIAEVEVDSGAGGEEGRTERTSADDEEEEDDDDDDDDILRWQIPFLIGRLCARLGRHPRMVLENLSQAVRLAKVT